jgi:RNA polymerase sigma factor (TIGR02999 family)
LTGISRLLSAIEQGDPHAAGQLWALVYDELRRLAASKLAHEAPGQTLQATALVHEAYLRLVDDPTRRWAGTGHFFAAAANAMQRILIDNARRKRAAKRGGHFQRHDLDPDQIPVSASASGDLLALDEALNRLAAAEPQVAELVKLRYFAGLSIPEAAATLGVSSRTADAWWAYARAWLLAELQDAGA